MIFVAMSPWVGCASQLAILRWVVMWQVDRVVDLISELDRD
jgi:hypothetical protein